MEQQSRDQRTATAVEHEREDEAQAHGQHEEEDDRDRITGDQHRKVPQAPEDADDQAGPEGRDPPLQAGQGESAQAELLAHGAAQEQ